MTIHEISGTYLVPYYTPYVPPPAASIPCMIPSAKHRYPIRSHTGYLVHGTSKPSSLVDEGDTPRCGACNLLLVCTGASAVPATGHKLLVHRCCLQASRNHARIRESPTADVSTYQYRRCQRQCGDELVLQVTGFRLLGPGLQLCQRRATNCLCTAAVFRLHTIMLEFANPQLLM